MSTKRRRGHDRKRRHDGADSHTRRRRRRTKTPAVPPPRPSPRVFCHICVQNHWTVECPRLRAHPEDHPLMDRKRGCWKCAQRGHTAEQCPMRKFLCRECGGVHDTKECAFDYVGKEWHEFFDPVTRHLFYTNAEDTEAQWLAPTHELDVVLWLCPHCQVMIPSKYQECVQCHRVRPQSAPTDDDESSSSSASDSSSGLGSDRDNGAVNRDSSSDYETFD
ncbi:unnamed protein product [Phytomonas sp. EM1]|nr:unnamed protein product [Phytomonas sp. EM1]|eukprot:CCW60712.1 unnamed protein product [Phytomonas sp. isolate EM1]